MQEGLSKRLRLVFGEFLKGLSVIITNEGDRAMGQIFIASKPIFGKSHHTYLAYLGSHWQTDRIGYLQKMSAPVY